MTFLGAAVVALVVFGPLGASAFHGGGVAHCDGCHTMHNSLQNPTNTGVDPVNSLLIGSDASSTCLNCHEGTGSYHILSTDGSNQGQGGDYFWLTIDYTPTIRGSAAVFSGDNHGHNVIALDFGLTEDATGIEPDPIGDPAR
jgi:hypothetical protein